MQIYSWNIINQKQALLRFADGLIVPDELNNLIMQAISPTLGSPVNPAIMFTLDQTVQQILSDWVQKHGPLTLTSH